MARRNRHHNVQWNTGIDTSVGKTLVPYTPYFSGITYAGEFSAQVGSLFTIEKPLSEDKLQAFRDATHAKPIFPYYHDAPGGFGQSVLANVGDIALYLGMIRMEEGDPRALGPGRIRRMIRHKFLVNGVQAIIINTELLCKVQ